MTVISTQQPSYPLPNPHIQRITIIMVVPQVPRKWYTGVLNWTKEICGFVLMKTTQDIVAVGSQSTLTEGLVAVQGWKIKHDKSTIPSYTNIKLYIVVWGVAKTDDLVSKSDSDIESLTLSLGHWVSDIESLTWTVWHSVSDIECLTLSDWHWIKSTWQIEVDRHLRDMCG